MARIVGYVCSACEAKDEELFNDTEEKPEVLDRKCSHCGGDLKKHDMKANSQVWRYLS